MIRTDIKRQANLFLQAMGDKSDRTFAGYEDGLEVLIMFFGQYYEDDNRTKTVHDITPNDINYILRYFVIRKYLSGAQFRVKTAKAVKAFFKFLAATSAYDTLKAKEIVAIADYYKQQYPRLDKLEQSLWDDVEGEVDRIMLLPQEQQSKEIVRLRESVKDAKMMEAGYVEIQKIEDNNVYGVVVDDDGARIGPVRIDKNSIELVQVGDTINMITLRQKKDDAFWEIAELGYVYPKSYFAR